MGFIDYQQRPVKFWSLRKVKYTLASGPMQQFWPVFAIFVPGRFL
jgi:hypothetical protein